MDKSFKIAELIVKQIKGTINSEELIVLDKWVKAKAVDDLGCKVWLNTE